MTERFRSFVSRRVIGLEAYIGRLDLDVWEGALPPSPEELRERTYPCEGLVSMLTDRIDADFLNSMQRLKVVSNYAVGVNNIDLAAAKAQRIQVGHTPGVLTESTADLAFALLMATARNIITGTEYARQGNWQTWDPTLLLGQDVWGATLGIVGYGRIGRAMAARGRGFNMRVLTSGRSTFPMNNVEKVSLDELLSESDFVSLHIPLTPETYHLIGSEQLGLMKPTAILINTARGEIVDPIALVEALQTGRPAYAGLDVTETEPLPANHPLYALPNCVIVPHLASATAQSRLGMT